MAEHPTRPDRTILLRHKGDRYISRLEWNSSLQRWQTTLEGTPEGEPLIGVSDVDEYRAIARHNEAVRAYADGVLIVPDCIRASKQQLELF